MAEVKSIGIIGNGVVGNATAEAFKPSVETVYKWDLDPNRSTHSLQEVLTADLIFICLPTPMYFDGSCDLSAIIQFFTNLKSTQRHHPFILRSTVPVGTTRMFIDLYGIKYLLYSPEFLTARTAVNDACDPRAMYIGSDRGNPYLTKLQNLYKAGFADECPVITTGVSESEAIKNFMNAFFAVKVTFFNELRAFADKKNLDWESVIQGILADQRIDPNHTKVPGPDGLYGFGGACLPKDMRSLLIQMWRAETPHKVLNAVAMENEEFRNKRVD
jgi:UDPglucose 6-dehydrogenase